MITLQRHGNATLAAWRTAEEYAAVARMAAQCGATVRVPRRGLLMVDHPVSALRHWLSLQDIPHRVLPPRRVDVVRPAISEPGSLAARAARQVLRNRKGAAGC